MFTAFIEQKVTLENMEELYRNSPIAYIDQVKTPLLIIHSENDYRCPLEQAEQMYVQLKFRERITELVIYPNSSHGLSRNGFPPFRVDRLQRIRDWFDRYMKEQKPEKGASK
jgi:dipeptidyl aminopeptidase/acylaminoacyl peptidase